MIATIFNMYVHKTVKQHIFDQCYLIVSNIVIYSSNTELKAQVSFSDRLLSVVCPSVV